MPLVRADILRDRENYEVASGQANQIENSGGGAGERERETLSIFSDNALQTL